MNTFTALQNLKALESHCYAAKEATAHYLQECESNRIEFLPGFQIRDVRDCHDNLEDTYILRLFAEFEVTLRTYWSRAVKRQKPTKPPVSRLLDSLGSRLYVLQDDLNRAHAVRAYRNTIIHGGEASPVTLSEARSYLCTFMSNLPREF